MRSKILAVAASLLVASPSLADYRQDTAAGSVTAFKSWQDALSQHVGGIILYCDNGSSVAVVCSDPTAVGPKSTVTGNVASGAADSGSPVKVGGVYNSTIPTFANGQRGDLQVGTRGGLHVDLYMADSNTAVAMGSGNADAQGAQNGTIRVFGHILKWNGASYDREFACPNTAVVNVTAGSTTEIVALTASQIIRVCGFSISMSAAGTAKFVQGTGTNCGTGTGDITGAMTLATGTPWQIHGGSNSVLRAAVSNALCVVAATGNAVGFINYAKY
jgi:hypothetical protein